MWSYFFVFVGSLFVDLIPFFGPPAWIVMVFFQMHYNLNIFWVLVNGVLGSTLGRYILSKYIPFLSAKLITDRKNKDIQFIGQRLSGDGWGIQLFVLLYTLMPLPSTPLFTASGMAKIRAMHILPAFFIGKFLSDMVMVISGNYVANNTVDIISGIFSWKSLSGSFLGIIIICVFLFIDWRILIQQNKFRINFNIFK